MPSPASPSPLSIGVRLPSQLLHLWHVWRSGPRRAGRRTEVRPAARGGPARRRTRRAEVPAGHKEVRLLVRGTARGGPTRRAVVHLDGTRGGARRSIPSLSGGASSPASASLPLRVLLPLRVGPMYVKQALRFIPSEFGMDPSRMSDALEPGRVTFDEKMEIRKAIEEATIPHTYISANCFAAYFCPNLCQMRTLLPPKDKVHVYGDGNVKVVLVDEDDIATYTIKSIDDPRTLNKTIYLRPQENILSQNDVIGKWERLSGKVLEKIHLPADEFLDSMKDTDLANQVGVTHYYHMFYEGCLTNFEMGENEAEATLLYPEVQYTRMDEYMKIYL